MKTSVDATSSPSRMVARSIAVTLLVIPIFAISVAHTAELIQVQRYEDADEYLPAAERKNADGVRLYLRQQPGEETMTAISDRNVSIKVIAMIPDAAKAGVILFPGGSAQLSMNADDRLDRSFSFVSRSRDYYWSHGIATFLVDAPSDHVDRVGLTPAFRSTHEFAMDIRAATMPDLPVASYTLVSPVYWYSDGSRLVTDTKYTKPVQIVENKDDACKSSHASGIEKLAKEISAPSIKVSWVIGGKNELGPPCSPFSRHSFIGAEDAAVKAIVESF